jgi:hypothetical protein
MTVLAIVSDVAYGSREFLQQLSSELKEQGIIDQETTIDHASDLLAAISKASGDTAAAFDTPPLSVDGLKQTIEQTRAAVGDIDFRKAVPQSELNRIWKEMQDVAKKENVSMLDLSTAVSMFTMQRVRTVGRGAMSGVRVAGNMFDQHILQHYVQGIDDVRNKGFYSSLAETSGPYISAVWSNFADTRETWTEDVLTGRALKKAWNGLWRRKE